MAAEKTAVLSGFDEDDLEAMTTPRSRQKRTWAAEKASWRIDTGMQTFHEFLAKKALVLPNLFRVEPVFAKSDKMKKAEREGTRGKLKKPRVSWGFSSTRSLKAPKIG